MVSLKITLPFLKKPPATTTTPNVQIQQFAKGLVSVKDVVAPSAVEVDFDFIKIGNTFFRTLFVAGYPRFVTANWLSPLVSFDHSLDVSMFIYPQESKEILDNLKRKVGEMEATIQSDIKRGRVIEPSVQVALEDALDLQQQLTKGAERFFQFGLYITIPAETLEELNHVSKQVESTLASLLIMTKRATLQMEEGFKSTLPMGRDRLLITRNMDTTSLGTTFPFTTSELTANEGILYGINEHNDSLVIFDRFTLENANTVVFGKSIARWEPVLIREKNEVRIEKIGTVIEDLITRHGITYKDTELEGVRNPSLEVFAYDKNLKGKWAKVSIAARKPFSRREKLYQITTKSGRTITVTSDHSLVILRNGQIRSIRGQAVKIGEAVPILRSLPEPSSAPQTIVPKELLHDWPDSLPQTLFFKKALLTLLGLTTSEGFITPKTLSIYNTDPEVLDVIVKSAASIGAHVSPRWKYPQRALVGYNIQPSVYAKLFFVLGAGGKSGEKRIPPLLFSLINTQIAIYLRAYFEGDGTVSEKAVSCTSKSKELISDFAYLLLRFGIIARIHPKQKLATNSPHQGDTYYELTISGSSHLTKFANQIGFITQRKQQKLASLLGKTENTNVDTIPTLQKKLQRLYEQLYQGDDVRAPLAFSPLKRGVFMPSRKQLLDIIYAAQNRINHLRQLRKNILYLNKLPSLKTLVARGTRSKRLNHLLWQELGYSWQLMKKQIVIPKTTTVLRAHKTVSGETIILPEIKQVLYETFKETGVSLLRHNKSLWSSLVLEARRTFDTQYPTLLEAVLFLKKRYQHLQLKLRHAEKTLTELRLLATSDLFWDPIVKIENSRHQEKYVYDLTVDNHVFLGGHGGLFVHNSGGGKSYLVKLEILRSIMFGTEVIIIDPENEYEEMSKTVGGEYITFSFNAATKINPFDLSQLTDSGENELGLKILSLHGLFKVIMGKLTPEEDAILDRALILTYKQKGITQDAATQTKEPPLMEDLYKVLVGMEEAAARGLADRIEKFIKGSLTGLINEQSNVDIKNPFTVFSIRDLADELRPVAMYILLDFIWTKIRRDVKKRILIVDEAWYMMKYPDSANFLNSIAKRARKYYLGLTTITQDVEDFLAGDLGKAIVQNSSLQILLKQSAAAIDRVAEIFYLSEGEKHLLLAADVGEGLFFAGPAHVSVRVIASPEEHTLVTTKPEEVLARKIPKTPAETREVGPVQTIVLPPVPQK